MSCPECHRDHADAVAMLEAGAQIVAALDQLEKARQEVFATRALNIVTLHDHGYNGPQIARAFRISRERVQQILADHDRIIRRVYGPRPERF